MSGFRKTADRGVKYMELSVCGCRIHATLQGSGPQRVVLLHGWGCSSELMQPLSNALKTSMQVLSFDFPGFGQSSRPPEPWGVPEYARMLEQLLRQLDLIPCDVIAHSFGARIAIFLASSNHSLFRRMVLTGAAGIRPPQSEEARKRSEEFKKLKKIAETLRSAKVFGSLPDRLEDKIRQKYGSRDYNALDAEMRKTFVRVIGLDLSERLPEIHVPTLLIWGDQDTETPLWMGQQMEHAIADSGLVVFEGGTHFAYLEQQDRFHAIVRHFLLED